MQASVRGLAGLVQDEIGEAAGGVASRAALSGLSGLFFLVALGFFVAAGAWALIFAYGVVVAMAILGGIFLAAACIVLLAARWRARRRADALAWARRRRQAAMRRFATQASLNGALGLAGIGGGRRGYVVPVATGLILGWLAERRLRRH